MTSANVPQFPVLRRALRRLESIIGLVFCWGIGLPGFFFLAAFYVAAIRDPAKPLWLIALVGIGLAVPVLGMMWVQFSMFRATWAGQYQPDALGIEAANRMPRWPLLIRPIVALWWLMHFGVGVLIALALELQIYAQPSASENRAPPEIVIIAVSYALTFAGNTFFLLCVGSFVRDERVLRQVWSWRFTIDAFVTFVPALFAVAGLFR